MDDVMMTGSVDKTEGKNQFLPGEKLKKQFRAWEEHKSNEVETAKQCWRFYHGDQWTDNQKAELNRREQPIIHYNEIRRKVNGFVGVEESMRRDPKAYPRHPNNKSEKHADIATKSLRFVCDNNNFGNLSAKVALRGGVGGVSGVEFNVVERRGQSVIEIGPLPISGFFYDPRSEEEDFSDAKFMGTYRWVDVDDAIEMAPEAEETILALIKRSEIGESTQAFAEPDKQDVWASFKKNSLHLVEHWYKYRGEWFYALHCGDHVLKEMKSPYRDDEGRSCHKYELWSPLIDHAGERYGIVRDMIPIQKAVNQRSSKLLHMLNTRQTMAEEGAVEDVDEMKSELHKASGHVKVNTGYKVDIITNSDQVSGQMNLLQHDLAQMDRFGPNNALIGRGTEHQSGVAIREQKVSGVAELSPELQELRDWKLRCYRKMWGMIREFWTDERFVRVTDDLGASEFLKINMVEIDGFTGEVVISDNIQDIDVDIILDEGPDTVTMQQEDFATLMQVAPFLKSSGQHLPPKVFFTASPLRNKADILKMLDEHEAKAEDANNKMRQRHDEEYLMRMRELDADINETVSKTDLNRSRSLKELQAADKLDNEDIYNSLPITTQGIPPDHWQ